VISEVQERDARRFWRNLDDVVARARPGQPVPGLSSIEGSDASGTVYCVVDLGGNLSRVEIFHGWWEVVGPAAVGAAVLDALSFAREKAGLAYLLLDRHRIPHRNPCRGLESSRVPPAFGEPETGALLRRDVGQAVERLDAARRLLADRADGRDREVVGPRELFSVTLRGTRIVSAAAGGRVRPADGRELAMDAYDALMKARPRIRP
jgi:hypothetical protein